MQVQLGVIKDHLGFGFDIVADGVEGVRVCAIANSLSCPGLQRGDVLRIFDGIGVHRMALTEVPPQSAFLFICPSQ